MITINNGNIQGKINLDIFDFITNHPTNENFQNPAEIFPEYASYFLLRLH